MNVLWLRQNIRVISQEPVLLATIIAVNIQYGRDGVTKEKIEKAARNANAYDFISNLPKVGETGPCQFMLLCSFVSANIFLNLFWAIETVHSKSFSFVW